MTASLPNLRPFRALRYETSLVGDLSALICPPYDVISPEERKRLLARHPYNVVRIELPATDGVREDPYRHAAETLFGWRRDGVLTADGQPAWYVYEQRYHLPGDGAERTQRGLFARLRLEPWGDGVRPHERTMSGPKEDRLRLLRATATNTSPIVVLWSDPDGHLRSIVEAAMSAQALSQATDDDGVRHRLWATAGPPAELWPDALTVADGHHRYETALRYREERRATRGEVAPADARGDAAYDHVLALVLDAGGEAGAGPTVLPTHRLIAGDPGAGGGDADIVARAGSHFVMTARSPDDLVRSFSAPYRAGGAGRFGLLADGHAWELSARRAAIEPLFRDGVGPAVRRLDVALLDAVLSVLLGPADVGRISYTHDASAARRTVESGEAAVAFLLDPTPIGDVLAVAAAGALMPEKSTYFYPKAATGLVMYPVE